MFQAQDEAILASFEEELTEAALSSSTVVNYLADLRAFLRWGRREIDSEFSLVVVNQAHIRLYRDYLIHKLDRAASTANRHLMSLKKFFAFALELGFMSLDPMLGIGLLPDEGAATGQTLTRPEVEKLLAAAGNGSRAGLVRRDVAILHLLIDAGLRTSEVVNLRTGDLLFDDPGVRLRVSHAQDGSKTRYLPLTGEICRVLNDYLAFRPRAAAADHFFLNQRGRAISDRTVQRIVSDCARAANLAGVSAQTLRRTYAQRLWEQTEDLALVSGRLGHQTKAITAQYLFGAEGATLSEFII